MGQQISRVVFPEVAAFSEKYPEIYKEYIKIEDELLSLFSKKSLDYGIGNISAGTQLRTDSEKRFALQGIWFRMMDKMNRWKNLTIEGKEPENESLEDTFRDLAIYAIIANIVASGKWHE